MTQTKRLPAEQSTRPKREHAARQLNGEAPPLPFDPWTRASQVAIIALFVIALLWGAQIAQPVLVPILLAWVIATIVHPVVSFMHRHKVPRVVAAILVTVAFVMVVVGLLASFIRRGDRSECEACAIGRVDGEAFRDG
jgi:hypothetical protein